MSVSQLPPNRRGQQQAAQSGISDLPPNRRPRSAAPAQAKSGPSMEEINRFHAAASREVSRQVRNPVLAQKLKDDYARRAGYPTQSEVSDYFDAQSVASELNDVQKFATGFEQAAMGTVRAIGNEVDYRLRRQFTDGLRINTDPGSVERREAASQPGTPNYYTALDKLRTASDQDAEYLVIDPTNVGALAGTVADPVWAATYGIGRAAIAPRGINAVRAGRAALADDVIAGLVADSATSMIQNRGDLSEAKNDVGTGVVGAVGLDMIGRGVGRLGDRFRPSGAVESPPVQAATGAAGGAAEQVEVRRRPRPDGPQSSYNPNQLEGQRAIEASPGRSLLGERPASEPIPEPDTPLYSGIPGAERLRPPQEPLNPGEALRSSRNFSKPSLRSRAADTASAIRKTFDVYTMPVIDRIREISPRLYGRLYKYATESNLRKHRLRTRMDPLLTELKKSLPKDVRQRLNSAMLNGDEAMVFKIADEMGGRAGGVIQQTWGESRRVLDEMFNEAKAVGLDVNYLDRFWPRLIKRGRADALREAVNGRFPSAYDDALREVAARKYGGSVNAIPEMERIAILDRVTAGYGPRAADSANPRPLKHRRIGTISDDLLYNYEDFDVSMDAYIERMSNEIAKRRLLGGNKTVEMGNLANLQESVGDLLMRENIVGKQAEEVRSMLEALFTGGEAPVGKVTSGLRSVGYAGAMGQITSAITQLGDLATVIDQRGLVNALQGTYRSLLGKSDVKLLDLGLDRIAEEFTNGFKSQKAVDFIFQVTGLRAIDRAIKNGSIEASMLEAKRAVRQPGTARFNRFKQKLRSEYGADAANRLIRDFQRGNVTEDVLVYLTAKMGDIQPVTKLEVPEGYLRFRDAGGGRFPALQGLPVLAYQLKTFSLRRLGIIRRDAIDVMAKGIAEMSRGNRSSGSRQFLKGARRLAAMVALLAGTDAAIDQVKNWITGKDESYWESLGDSMWQLVGLNRYGLDQFQRGGNSGFSAMLAPPAYGIIGDFIADGIKLMKDPGASTRSERYIPHYRTWQLFQRQRGEGERERRPRPARTSR